MFLDSFQHGGLRLRVELSASPSRSALCCSSTQDVPSRKQTEPRSSLNTQNRSTDTLFFQSICMISENGSNVEVLPYANIMEIVYLGAE